MESTMSQERILAAALESFSPGELHIQHTSPDDRSIFQHEQMTAQLPAEGKAVLKILPLYPGVEVCFHRYLTPSTVMHHGHPEGAGMEINHCRWGRIGWTLNNGCSLYLGEGDASLHGMHLCADSEMQFPVGYYEGICFTVDAAVLDSDPPEFLRSVGISAQAIFDRFQLQDRTVVFAEHEQIAALFDSLYTVPERLLLPSCQLKFQELVLMLSYTELPATPQDLYKSSQIEVIRQIHDQLMSDLSQRCTIEELSRKYLMNSSTLKDIFKTVYGVPIAAHMKEHRMKRAAELLRTTSMTLADVASQVGYESQSKFSTAFKSIYGILPSEYRKQKQ